MDVALAVPLRRASTANISERMASMKHNSRLAKALRTKREDIRDPNEGAHPRVRERAEAVWLEKVHDALSTVERYR